MYKLTFIPEYYGCPKCGEQIQKHLDDSIFYHLRYFEGRLEVCSEKDCEINHYCKKLERFS